MKRRVVLILLLLVAGAIVNVAVAWGCAMWSGASLADMQKTPYLDDSLIAWWNARFPDRDPHPATVPEDQMTAFSGFDGATTWEAAAFGIWGRNMLSLESSWLQVAHTQSGWPLKSLAGEWHLRHPELQPEDFGLIRADSIPRPVIDEWGSTFGRFLPLRPIWPGFAINTVFYAFILWLLFAAPFALRRRRRIKRGLCPKCAYPVGTNEVCTECGTAVRKQVDRLE